MNSFFRFTLIFLSTFFRFTLIFLSTYLLLSLFFPPDKEPQKSGNNIDITIKEENPTIGDLIEVTISNNKNEEILLNGNFSFEEYKNGSWENVTKDEYFKEEYKILPHEKQTLSFSEKNTLYFEETGKYRAKIKDGEKEFFADFTIEEPGFWGTIWRVIFWKPIYNALIGLLAISGKELGVAIILLTIFIKIILLIPTQKAMKSQRKMQKLQPELQRIKDKYKGDQQKIATETMALWKKHEINPMGALTPILLQFPVLIALFYVIQEGLLPHNEFFLYSLLKDFDFSGIITNFLGVMPLNLSPYQHHSLLWLPFIVGGAQFFAMKLSFARANKEKKKQENDQKNKSEIPNFAEELQKMNKVFLWIFPLMITFFTASMPSAVGLYWLISTLFGIGQQYQVNKEIK